MLLIRAWRYWQRSNWTWTRAKAKEAATQTLQERVWWIRYISSFVGQRFHGSSQEIVPLITFCELTDTPVDFCRSDVPAKETTSIRGWNYRAFPIAKSNKPVLSPRVSCMAEGSNPRDACNAARRPALVNKTGEWLSMPRPISLIKESIHLSFAKI